MSARKRKIRKAKRARTQRRPVVFLAVFGTFVVASFVGAIGVVNLASSWISDLPEYDNIDSYADSGITTIYASDRKTKLAKVYLENRIEVGQSDISQYVIDGTVATEDQRFYTHKGVDPDGILRAVAVNLTSSGRSEGASTITQQLVRNTVLLNEMNDISFKRKVREMYIALKVEEVYSKDQILNMYLNVINYGDGCYGIETAARNYFGKHAKDLTLSEAALLIGIPQSPTANNPRTHYDNALSRRALVLRRMLDNGYITKKQYDKVIDKKPKIKKATKHKDTTSNLAPYFVDYVKQLLKDSKTYPQEQVSKGGLSVYTTLDVSCQKAANESVKEGVADYDSALDGSLVSINPSTGNIVAMVGGKDYSKSQFNLATQMSRQAGSSFKTFALLAALKEGVDPDNTYIDSSSPAQVGKKWTVNNSEGTGYGSMSITSATTSSVNTVYARLVHGIGADKLVSMAKDCGITSDLQPYDSLALGAQGVNVLDMASAYATIAAGGIYREPVAISQITDSHGSIVYTHEHSYGTRVFSQQIANKATEILQTVVQYGTGTRASLSSIGQQAAGKTGTSQKGRDLWFCGYTPQYATAIWAGYSTEKSTYLYGGHVCAPIWRSYMLQVLDGVEATNFDTTDDKVEYKDSNTWNFTGQDDDDDSSSSEYEDEGSYE